MSLERVKSNLEDVVGGLSDADIQDAIQEALGLKGLIREMIEKDDEIRNALMRKIKNLILKEIKNVDDLGDLYPDGDFVLAECISVQEIITELLHSDDEVKYALKEKVKELVLEFVEDMACSDLPDNVKESLNLPDEIAELALNSDFREKLSDKIQEVLITPDVIGKVAENLKDDSDVLAFAKNQVIDLLQDQGFRAAIAEKIRSLLLDNKKGGEVLLTALAGVVVTALTKRLLQPQEL